MPDGNAPSLAARKDPPNLLYALRRDLEEMHWRTEGVYRISFKLAEGFEELNHDVRIGAKFSSFTEESAEDARQRGRQAKEVMERVEEMIYDLDKADRAHGDTPTVEQQLETVAAFEERFKSLQAEEQVARAQAAHLREEVLPSLWRRTERAWEIDKGFGERMEELSALTGRSVTQYEECADYAQSVIRYGDPKGEAAAFFLGIEMPESGAKAGKTKAATPEPQPGTAETAAVAAEVPTAATAETEDERDAVQTTQENLRRKATAGTMATEQTETIHLNEATEPPKVADGSVTDALQEASEKNQRKEKNTAAEPERTLGEPATETKGQISKPARTERPDQPEAPIQDTGAEPERPSSGPAAREINSAAIASAIQTTLAPQPEPAIGAQADQGGPQTVSASEEVAIRDALAELKEKNAKRKGVEKAAGPAEAPFDLVTDLPNAEGIPRPISRTERASINEARAELKEKYAERKRNADIVTLYGERMSARGWEYLQAHDPARYRQLQATQATVQNLTIDATVFLQPEERQAVHLAAIVDVRTTFPDLTDALLSTLLLRHSLALLEQQETTDKQAALAAVAAVLAGGAAQAAGAAAAPAVFAALTKQISATREALAHEEKRAEERAGALRTQAQATPSGGGGSVVQAGTAPTPNVADLQAQQRQGLDARRALQAALHAQVQQLAAGNALGNALAQQEGLTGAQAEAANGLLAFILPANLRAAAGGEQVSAATGRNLLTGGNQTEAQRREETIDPADRAAYENDLAAKLAARQMQDRRFQDVSQASVGAGGGSGGTSSSALIGNDGNPLLEGKRLRPLSPQEVFAQKQAAMRKRAEAFTGTGATAGGFEAAFGSEEALPNAGAGVIELQDGDLIPVEDGTEGVAEAEEEARLQALLERQQADRLRSDNASRLDDLRKTKDLLNSPAGKQALTKAAPLLSNPIAWVIALLLLIVWLNVRLFFPNEESALRKPLGTWGKLGTIAFDLLAVINVAVSFVLLVVICILPFLPVLLALGGIFATLQGNLRLFGN